MSQARVCGMRVLHHALNTLINVISTRVRWHQSTSVDGELLHVTAPACAVCT